ncbi:hypothetical protein Lser_V15G16019 [Lactuca serriola]
MQVGVSGDEKVIKGVTDWITNDLKEVAIEIVGLDMELERESVVDEAVEKTWSILGKVDALVNCYTYEGI